MSGMQRWRDRLRAEWDLFRTLVDWDHILAFVVVMLVIGLLALAFRSAAIGGEHWVRASEGYHLVCIQRDWAIGVTTNLDGTVCYWEK